MSENKYYHEITINQDRCKGRLRCTKDCPTNALRSFENKVTLMDDLCIDCGNCFQACPENVFTSEIDKMGDFDNFKYLIAIPTPVLYTQFGVDINPNIIKKALENIGFDEVVNIYDTSNEVGYAINHHISTNKDKVTPIIISYCPTVVRYIQVSYPNLVPNIANFNVPREIKAREIKTTYPEKLGLKPEEIGVVYITPCPAKVVSIKQPAENAKSWIDSAVPIRDIYNLILPDVLDMHKNNKEEFKNYDDFKYCRGWVAMNIVQRSLGAERCISVSGLDDIKRILDDVENSKLKNIEVIEAHSCIQECLGGAFCVENPYIARHKSIDLSKKCIDNITLNKDHVIEKYNNDYYFLEKPLTPRVLNDSKKDIATSIKKMKQKERILAKLPRNNCGLCGAPTCEVFAEDCASGKSDFTQCVFLADK